MLLRVLKGVPGLRCKVWGVGYTWRILGLSKVNSTLIGGTSSYTHSYLLEQTLLLTKSHDPPGHCISGFGHRGALAGSELGSCYTTPSGEVCTSSSLND